MSKWRRLEVDIEGAFVRKARTYGCHALKFKTPNRRFVPDRIILGRHRLIFFIEFKQHGKEPEAGQLRTHRLLRYLGFNIYVCDTLEQAVAVLEQEIRDRG